MNVSGILLLALLVLAAGPQRTTDDRLGSIEGIVVKAGTSLPIGGATVELTWIAPRTVGGSSAVGKGVISVSVEEAESDGKVLSNTATTRADGKFAFHNILPGTEYQLVALNPPDYLPAQYGQRTPTLPGRSIVVNPGEQIQDIRIEMTPGATISGQVVDSTGLGVRNVLVELRRPWYLEGWRLLAEWNELIGRVQGVGKTNRAAVARTNSRGEFRFAGLAPAQYYVRTEFTNEATAKPINLHAGAIVNDLRIVNPEIDPLRVRGAILDASGAPLSRGQVVVVPRNGNPLYQNARIDAQPVRNGFFQVTVPRPGSYLLVAAAPGNPSALLGRKEIEVRDTDLTDVRVSVAGEFSISGSVAFEGSRMAADPVRDMLSVGLYPTSLGIPTPTVVKPSANGSFTVEGVTAGDYRVELLPVLTVPPSTILPTAMENVFVKSIRLDRQDILNGGLHVETPPRGALQVVVSMNGGAIEGRVLDADAKPVANVKAVAVPNAPRRQRGDLYKYDSTDDSGRFQLKGLAPGDYKLFAFERVEEGAWQDSEFIKLFEDRGKAVHIDESDRVATEVRLIPAWN